LLAALMMTVTPAVFAQEPPSTPDQPPAQTQTAPVVTQDAIPQAASEPPLPAVPEARPVASPIDARVPVGPVGDDAAFQIGPEDVLDISVWKNPELSRVVPVRPDGKVSLPLVNDIQAAGLTPAALREQVAARLAEFIPSPEVSVMVREVHSRKVAVLGAVKTPGRFELKSTMTVLEVIALAQGFTDFASRDRIVVLRNEGGTTKRLPFNYRRIAEGAMQENFIVRPGDIVVVP
jgi:polysaccharide export outer membrane protein